MRTPKANWCLHTVPTKINKVEVTIMFLLFFIPHPSMHSFSEIYSWAIFWIGICFIIFCYLAFQMCVILKKQNGRKRIFLTVLHITIILVIALSSYLLLFDYFTWWLIHSVVLFAYSISPLKRSTESLYLFKTRIPIIAVCILNIVWMSYCMYSSAHSGYWHFINNHIVFGLSGYKLNEIWYVINIATTLVCKVVAARIKEKRFYG